MNLQESIARLESLGYKVYPKENKKFSVWWPGQKNQSEDYQYTAREVVGLARSQIGTNRGKKEVKYMTNKRLRRKTNQKIRAGEEDFDVNLSLKCDPWKYD